MGVPRTTDSLIIVSGAPSSDASGGVSQKFSRQPGNLRLIHALDLETKGSGNVLQMLTKRLLEAGFDKNDLFVKQGPHFLVFIQSVETVRRYLDPSYHPYDEGIFARPGLQPMIKVELPIWTAYLDGKMSREDALNQIVDGFLKAPKDAHAKIQSN